MLLAGYFVTREMGLAKIYRYTKFEVSSFTHSRFMEEGLKFKICALDPDQAPFGGILSRMRWDLPRFIHVPNLKLLASPVSNLGNEFKNLKIRPWTLLGEFYRA